MPKMTEVQQIYYDKLKKRIDHIKTNIEREAYSSSGSESGELELLLGKFEGERMSMHSQESEFTDLYDFALSNQFMPEFNKLLVQLNRMAVKYESMMKH